MPTTQAPPNPAVSPLRQRFRLINRNRQPFRPRPRAPPPPAAAAAAAPVRPALVQNNQVGIEKISSFSVIISLLLRRKNISHDLFRFLLKSITTTYYLTVIGNLPFTIAPAEKYFRFFVKYISKHSISNRSMLTRRPSPPEEASSPPAAASAPGPSSTAGGTRPSSSSSRNSRTSRRRPPPPPLRPGRPPRSQGGGGPSPRCSGNRGRPPRCGKKGIFCS